ncbi:MAG: S9 family peptidase, partial [Oxalobacteraceae bacterium]
MDVYTRNRSRVASAPLRGASFASDAAGVVRFAHGSDQENNGKLYYRDNDKAEWRLLNDQAQSGHGEWPLGLSADGASAYLQVENEKGPDSIMVMDLASGKRREKLRDPLVDPYSVILDRGDWTPIGAFFMSDRMRTRFFEPESATARLYGMLEKAFPGQLVHVTSSTTDGRLLVVGTWSDTSPGDYYLYDTQSGQADLIFSRRNWFDPAKMSPMRAIQVKARDGLQLHGYLSVPNGKKEQNLPMVVLPHGGPYGIFDQWDFDDEVQMLNRAGYAVLRINFRGSGNYGKAFIEAGAREWGLKMQDDITDATRWAIAQKIADPSRICIYGASYGGYAALMGVSKEPDLYRCAVGYVGVYDLTMMHKAESRQGVSMRNWTADWLGERADQAAVSPTNAAARIKVPVFLAAGGEDDTAPIAHSKRMAKALKAAGVPVETLYYQDEGHGFYT